MPEVDDWTAVDDWGAPPAAQSRASSLVGAAAPIAEEKPATGLLSPITDIPREVGKTTMDAIRGVVDNLNPLSERRQQQAQRGEVMQPLLDTGKGLLSAMSVPLAPIQGALHSLVGHPYAGVTGMPYDQAREAVDTAMMGMAPRGGSPIGARPSPLPPRPSFAGDELAAASDRLSVPVPRVAASDNLIAQRTGAALKEIPVVGDPLVKASRASTEALGAKAEDVASQYGSGNVLTAGDAAKSALSDWITGKSADITRGLYNKVDALVDQQAVRPLHETQGTVADLMARRIASGENSPGKAVDLVSDAVTRPGGLTYQGTKDLRTRIGSYLDGSILPEAGTSIPDLKQIYGALTKDLRGNVFEHGGPEGLAAFDKANRIASIVAARRESLAKIIGKDANMSSEGVLDRLSQMASTKSSANIDRLSQARKAIGPQGWDEVASAVLSRMGRDPAGNFTPDRFVTSWGKLSDAGKQTIFGSTGRSDLVQSLNDIATISERAQQIARYGNPSGTGRTTSVMGALGGMYAAPLATLGGLISGRVIASALSQPITAKAIAQWMKATQRAQLQATPPNVNAAGIATANMARSLGSLGLNPVDVLRGLQGAIPGRAQDQQQP